MEKNQTEKNRMQRSDAEEEAADNAAETARSEERSSVQNSGKGGKKEKGKDRRADAVSGGVRPVAVVVGASSGIGAEVASMLVLKGYCVVNVSRRVSENERVKNILADIAQGEELERALQTVGAEHGSISLLVYSAGCSLAAPLETAGETDIRYLFEVNYFGAVRAVRSVLPYMKKRGGRIVLVGSLAGTFPIPFDGFYSSSKAALDLLAKSTRTELRRYNIALSVAEPGGTSTSFTFKRKIYSDEENGEYAKSVHKAVAALGNIEQGGTDPRAVAESIVAQTVKASPAITFTAGWKNKVYRIMERLLPEKWTEYWNNKKYNQ